MLLLCNHLVAQNDSLKIKLPKHYFNTILLLDYYQKPKVDLPPIDYVHQKLKSYQIQQMTFAFSTPVWTKDIIQSDSSWTNFNLLLTGYFLSYNPNFSGLLEEHILKKSGVGIRMIYNNGKKSIFFADFSPFSTFDKNDRENTKVLRMASLLLWSFSPSNKFNLRLGLTKSFMWGNRYYLPFVGIRVGQLNKVNFSFQFPRIMSLNIPIKNYFQISLFTKPQGGLFSISNKDTIYPAFLSENKVVYIGRYEFLSGIRIDVKIGKHFNFYVAGGSTINNFLAMYSLQFNKKRQFEYRPFFRNEQGKTPFINFGLTLYLGKTKSYYNRYSIDEMKHLNNEMGVGDNNTQVYQPTDNFKRKETFKVDNTEVSDLINSFDY